MWKHTVIVIALFAGTCGGAQAAGLYGYPPADLSATGPSYTTVYVDENGYIVGADTNGPVTPGVARSAGETFRFEMLPHGAMSFGSIRVVPSPRAAAPYGY